MSIEQASKWAASPGAGDRSYLPDRQRTNHFIASDFSGDGSTGPLAATASVSSTLPDVELGNNTSATRIVASPKLAAFFVATSASAASDSVGSNANDKPVIAIRRINKTDVSVSVRIDKSKLPNGIPSSRTVKLTGRYFGKTYVMVETVIEINISVWTFTIPPGDIVDGPEPVIIQVIICGIVCGGLDDVVIEFEIVIIQQFEPSGIVTDRATLTLYKMPGAMPDEGRTTKECRTLNTWPGGTGGTWDSLPPRR